MLSAFGASAKAALRADVQPCAPCLAHRVDSAHHLPATALLSHSTAPLPHHLRALRSSSAALFPSPGGRADRGRKSVAVRASAEAETPQSERLQLNGSMLRADPLWSAVTEQVAIGASVTTAGADAVRALQTGFGMTAVVNVEEESAMKARGSSWEEERQRLEEQGVVAVWVPVKEHDATEQALMLPQVVRVVAALVAAGHTVLLQCSAGDRVSPLIAIGYLMFVRGMPCDAASALVAERRAGISPPMGVLTEAMEKVLAGATARVIEIAESIYRQRVRTGQAGDSNSDWVQAQRAYINEAFAKWLAADVSFAESIAQAAERKAREQQAAEEAERRANEPAKRLLTPIRWSASNPSALPPASPPAVAAGGSEAVAAANRRVAALVAELESVTHTAEEQAATLQRAGRQVAELTGQVEALQRKERLYTEALGQANERMELLGERMRAVEQQARGDKERLEGEVRALTARMQADEQRGGRAATVIQGLRMELQAAKDEVKEQWAAVARAEKSIGALSARVKEEEQRARRAEAAALAAEEDKRRALRELEGAKGESVAESAEARERMAALAAQVQQLGERLKAATGVAEKATGRADVLERQVAQLEARARQAEEQEAVSARAAGLLTDQVKVLEGSAAEASARVGQLSGELEKLRVREAERAAESVASGERAKQLMALVKDLSEREARQRTRAEQVEAKLAALRDQDSDLASRAAVFSSQMEQMARQLARLNAELAFAEGREGEVQEAWRAQLGAASDVMGAMGPEAAALAAERGVEMEMEQAEGQPGEVLRVLMQRVSSEAAAVRERSARLIEDTHHMRQQLDAARNQVQEEAVGSGEGAEARLREYVEAAEAMAVEQKQRLVERVQSLQWVLGATIALAVIIPATAFYSFFTDDSHATQVEMLRSRLAAVTGSQKELESAAVKADASKRAALSAVQTLEEVVAAQQGSVERLQALIPLVAPSIQSEQAARFCANVPLEYQSAVTQRFCSDLVPPTAPAAPATAQDS
ncbi:hypothetical protein CLOM_g4065 [Closterium sp. NIES-68]|nr:hypothetical protein CLOM_g4065 [Closterium sp. NIES-68]